MTRLLCRRCASSMCNHDPEDMIAMPDTPADPPTFGAMPDLALVPVPSASDQPPAAALDSGATPAPIQEAAAGEGRAMVKCRYCIGNGGERLYTGEWVTCPKCGGTGKRKARSDKGKPRAKKGAAGSVDQNAAFHAQNSGNACGVEELRGSTSVPPSDLRGTSSDPDLTTLEAEVAEKGGARVADEALVERCVAAELALSAGSGRLDANEWRPEDAPEIGRVVPLTDDVLHDSFVNDVIRGVSPAAPMPEPDSAGGAPASFPLYPQAGSIYLSPSAPAAPSLEVAIDILADAIGRVNEAVAELRRVVNAGRAA